MDIHGILVDIMIYIYIYRCNPSVPRLGMGGEAEGCHQTWQQEDFLEDTNCRYNLMRYNDMDIVQ
jgi:hypothetical protein